MRLLIIVLCLFGLSVPLLAEDLPTEEDIKLVQLENATRARELYQAGEAASKKGDLETAIWDWSQALKLKPDSAYTSKCLAQAREQLYKKYMSTVSPKTDAKDPVTAYVRATALVELMPDKKEAIARADKLKAGLTDGQAQALAAYQEARRSMVVGDYLRARDSLKVAETFARDCQCIDDASKELLVAASKEAPTSAAASEVTASLPQILFFGRSACSRCQKTKPALAELQSLYPGRFRLVYLDVDLPRNDELCRQYSVQALPKLVFFDSNRKEVNRLEGRSFRKQDLLPELARMGIQ